eukprot:Rhum_TRINITY_DN21250_c0_g1::Rhum_TRINITY_DN21250_c0_g1_i1::g.173555::m.173555
MSGMACDVWTAVTPYCDNASLMSLKSVCRWFHAECARDRQWTERLRRLSAGLHGNAALLRRMESWAEAGALGVCRAIAATPVVDVRLDLVHHTAVEWSHNYRCEHMLSPERGTFSTAAGVTNATVTCRAGAPFLLSCVRAKGGGRGFSSPLKRFAITAGGVRTAEMELACPAEESVFVFDPPMLSHSVDIHLLAGSKQGENIDTDYIVLEGKLLEVGAE